jgi:hypothetical protein
VRPTGYSASFILREKGARSPWEDGIPPGNDCSNRKQPERLGLATARVEAGIGDRPPNHPHHLYKAPDLHALESKADVVMLDLFPLS